MNKSYGPTLYKVVSNEKIGKQTMMMRLEGDTSPFCAPGMFVNVAIPGYTLRRPISVCDFDTTGLTLVYDIVGHGTKEMSEMHSGTIVDILPGLGNGFDISLCQGEVVLFGGGVGCPPIYSLAKTLISNGVKPTVIVGFNDESRIIMREMFEGLGIDFYIATLDGSVGTRGYVTDVLKEKGVTPDYFCACGPMPMLRALCTGLDIPGQVSIESRMGCGFGVCMCCSVETAGESKRICKDGPVFRKEELIWK